MSFDAYTIDDNGVVHDPLSRDWARWVSASRTRNWCLNNALQDWLERYGEGAGFIKDPAVDERTDFLQFIFAKGRQFETEVVKLLHERVGVVVIDCGDWPTQSFDGCRQTFEAMTRGVPIIHQGVVWNPSNETYGAPDLLVRSDVLRSLFPDALSEADARTPAPGLGAGPWHYRVVDIKFTSLQLDRHWNAGAGHLPYMAQTFVYNEALGRIQGYLPPTSYLLGRSWKGSKESCSSNCLDRLAPVPHGLMLKGRSLRDVAEDAVAWTRRLRIEGAGWDPKDAATHPFLRPNLGAASHPWTNATRQLAEDIADPTLAWQVGHDGREKARDAGVLRWTDPAFNASVVELGAKNGPTLDQMLDINRDPATKAVNPARIHANREVWGEPGAVEFYVDFETVSDVDDDFSRLPERGGQGQIFMIGCGHIEDGAWKFACFVAEELALSCEAEIIERWLAHMEDVRQRVAPGLEQPLVFHWSPAESSGLTNGLKSARSRHPVRSGSWAEPNWFDFLVKVMREEPVIIRGPMGFGLKKVARALKSHGLITTDWEDNVVDGLGAMVGAWRCYEEARADGTPVMALPLMEQIRRYNEVDCKVMQEAVAYLRSEH
ncbi:MAG: hypothetical protein M9925_15970 [Chloroflexi bacterium]|nr:hypothetical protein [Chloroflexota bacterium]